MKERPILFSASMVRAILAGQKTQTRRVLKHDGPPDIPPTIEFGPWKETSTPGLWIGCNEDGTAIFAKCQYGQPGDRLWVRETWGAWPHMWGGVQRDTVRYRATDHRRGPNWRWRPSNVMPRWACRILLDVTDVRVEQLQDISCNDIMREGFQTTLREHDAAGHLREQWTEGWDKLYGKRGFGWDVNPWVWVVSFRVTK